MQGPEFRSDATIKVTFLDSPSLIVLAVSVDIKSHLKKGGGLVEREVGWEGRCTKWLLASVETIHWELLFPVPHSDIFTVTAA